MCLFSARRHYDESGRGQWWSSWTEWTQCSVTSCGSGGTGYQSRQRVCLHHSHHHHHHHHEKQQRVSCKGVQTESRSCDSALLSRHKCKGKMRRSFMGRQCDNVLVFLSFRDGQRGWCDSPQSAPRPSYETRVC